MSSTLRSVLLSLIIFITLGLLLILFQQGDLLSARLLAPEATPLDTTAPDEEAADTGTKIEAYCQTIKEGHIIQCGQRYPEEDYICRTEEAEQVLQECLQETTIEEIIDPAAVNTETESPAPVPTADLPL